MQLQALQFGFEADEDDQILNVSYTKSGKTPTNAEGSAAKAFEAKVDDDVAAKAKLKKE